MRWQTVAPVHQWQPDVQDHQFRRRLWKRRSPSKPLCAARTSYFAQFKMKQT